MEIFFGIYIIDCKWKLKAESSKQWRGSAGVWVCVWGRKSFRIQLENLLSPPPRHTHWAESLEKLFRVLLLVLVENGTKCGLNGTRRACDVQFWSQFVQMEISMPLSNFIRRKGFVLNCGVGLVKKKVGRFFFSYRGLHNIFFPSLRLLNLLDFEICKPFQDTKSLKLSEFHQFNEQWKGLLMPFSLNKLQHLSITIRIYFPISKHVNIFL